MWKLIKEYRFYWTIGLLILVPILSFNTNKKGASDFNSMDRAIVFFTAPIQEVITGSINGVVWLFQNYVFLLNTRHDLASVVEENRKLLNQIQHYQEMEIESKRLKNLLQFQEKIENETTSAQVIAKDVSSRFRSIRINKGSQSGITRGMAVVTHEGVVGKILRITENNADILTILDNLSSVDAVVQRTRSHGVLEGATDFFCILKYVLRTDDIEVGDRVITSGLDGIYQKGLVIGNVSAVSKKNYGITQDVEVKPSVDFTKLEEVLVILKEDTNLL